MLNESVALLRAGELVAFPTETVYGLGADANNPLAIQKVFQAKGRPADHPVIVHIAEAKQIANWARDIPESAWILAKNFWPGPLTFILYKQPHVSPLITGNQETIGIRVPNHPLTLELLRQFGSGIVGPSANKYGRVSPTTAMHVTTDFGNEVAAVVDGGACQVGIESTIIDLTAAKPRIMRVGAISAAEIANVLGYEIAVNTKTTTLRTPGSHAAHYAPRTPAHLIHSAELPFKIDELQNSSRSYAVLSFNVKPANLNADIYWLQTSQNPSEYAHDLYANLRLLDQLHKDALLIEAPPQQDSWLAVIDRLTRATSA